MGSVLRVFLGVGELFVGEPFLLFLGDKSSATRVVFRKGMGFRIEVGMELVFGLMIAWGVVLFLIKLFRLFRAVTNNESSLRDCCVVSGDSFSWSYQSEEFWIDSKSLEYVSLLGFLSNVCFCKKGRC